MSRKLNPETARIREAIDTAIKSMVDNPFTKDDIEKLIGPKLSAFGLVGRYRNLAISNELTRLTKNEAIELIGKESERTRKGRKMNVYRTLDHKALFRYDITA